MTGTIRISASREDLLRNVDASCWRGEACSQSLIVDIETLRQPFLRTGSSDPSSMRLRWICGRLHLHNCEDMRVQRPIAASFSYNSSLIPAAFDGFGAGTNPQGDRRLCGVEYTSEIMAESSERGSRLQRQAGEHRRGQGSYPALRDRRPIVSSDGASAIAPAVGTSPQVGFQAVTPQACAGIRSEPKCRKPSAMIGTRIWSVTAAAEPDDDPPEMNWI